MALLDALSSFHGALPVMPVANAVESTELAALAGARAGSER